MVDEFGGSVRFVVENFGDSQLAKRFGVKRYPAMFVDDILVATPKDFGFYGKGEGEGGGRYAPLRSAASHERFRSDLEKILKLELAGRAKEARAAAPSQKTVQIGSLPALNVTDIDGKTVRPDDYAGRVVLVEFWATWCPPCRSTLSWLGSVKKKHGDRVQVITVAVESDGAAVAQVMRELGLHTRTVLGTPELARSFGDISAVPTLFVFDRAGKTVDVFYGAPPSLHGDAEKAIARAEAID